MSKRRNFQQDYDYEEDFGGSSYESGSYEYTFGSVPDSPISKSFEQHQISTNNRNNNNNSTNSRFNKNQTKRSPGVEEYMSPVIMRQPITKEEELNKLKTVVEFLKANGGDLEDPKNLEEIARRNNFDLQTSLAGMKYFQFSEEDEVGKNEGEGEEEEEEENGYPNDDEFIRDYGEYFPPPPPEKIENRNQSNKGVNKKRIPLEIPSQENNPRAIFEEEEKKSKELLPKNNNHKKSKKKKKKNNKKKVRTPRTPLPDISKTRLSLVIVGHVDAGKSTLVGQILVQCGVVDQKLLRAYQRESNEMGKGSFYLAWITDEDREERSRGVTVHLGIKQFETENKLVTILDSPGHRDFVPNMIMGAAQADMGVLVIDAVKGAFEAGFKSMGQTREHVLVASCLGVKNWIVAVNKMDVVGWDYKRFQEIEAKLTNWMVGSLRLKKRNIKFLPISGLTGINVTKNVISKPVELVKWYKNKKCLIQLVDENRPMKRMTNKPLRMSLHDVFKTKYSGVFVSGTVDSGVIFKGDKVEIHPIQEIVTIKKIRRLNQDIEKCFAGDYVELNITGNTEYENIKTGQILCPPNFPISYTMKFKMTMITFDTEFPVLKGTEVILHLLNKAVSANIFRILNILNKRKEVTIKKPRFLPKNSMAEVVIKTNTPICLELFKRNKTYGTLVVRKDGNTIASGIVTKIFKMK